MLNMLFFLQVVGVVFIGVGSWAHNEKTEYNSVKTLSADPTVLLILVGSLMFTIAFCGCVGFLRENKILLRIVRDYFIEYCLLNVLIFKCTVYVTLTRLNTPYCIEDCSIMLSTQLFGHLTHDCQPNLMISQQGQ